ncbi:enoyl-CoA hydratase [Pollutimonas nitritireducens]|uniref:Enoyl-CoA hydratase n=1 Tax=Pollutimonas nitritireducens TaxID=2045209 RepID=A0A2N4UG25_9BURK|nr:enoyl-CoA hydratase-related protein [Pollutimonas nitritireducens]PLC53973.1 enoyl-CoA hydratase [Pollutimonas nitritireducens]
MKLHDGDEPDLVKLSRHGSVLTIRLSSPDTRNAISIELREQLGRAIEIAERDTTVRAVFLTADGPTFCSGGDLKMLTKQCDPWTVHRRFRSLSRWLAPLINLDKPVVVGMRGAAVGGGMGLALTGDIIIGGESAKLVAGFFRVGVIPDVAAMYHLPRLIGMARAKNFIYSGGTLSAQEALELGLFAKVVPDDEVEEAGLAEAMRLAEGPAEVMGLAKKMMARSFETSLATMLDLEGYGQVLAQSSPEFHEGISAILERRIPEFARASAKAALGGDASRTES